MFHSDKPERDGSGDGETENQTDRDVRIFENRSYTADVQAPALTLRQIQILNCIEESIRFRGAPPTRRELLAMLGITSLRALREHLEYLAAKGFIRLDDDTVRGIAVLIPSTSARLKAERPGLAKTRAANARSKVGT